MDARTVSYAIGAGVGVFLSVFAFAPAGIPAGVVAGVVAAGSSSCELMTVPAENSPPRSDRDGRLSGRWLRDTNASFHSD